MKRELRDRRAWKPGTGSRRALEARSGKSHCLPGLHRGWGLAVEGRQELKVCRVSGDPEQGLLCCKYMASKAENREGWGGGASWRFYGAAYMHQALSMLLTYTILPAPYGAGTSIIPIS